MRLSILRGSLRALTVPLLGSVLAVGLCLVMALGLSAALTRFADLAAWAGQVPWLPRLFGGPGQLGLAFPAVLAGAAGWLGTLTLAREIERGRLELWLSRPFTRWQIWLEKWGAVTLPLAGLTLAGLVIYLLFSGPQTQLGTTILAFAAAWLTASFFAALALAVGAAARCTRLTARWMGGLLLVSILLYLAAIFLPGLSWLEGVSPFHPATTWLQLLVLLGLNLVAVTAGLIIFERCDIDFLDRSGRG